MCVCACVRMHVRACVRVSVRAYEHTRVCVCACVWTLSRRQVIMIMKGKKKKLVTVARDHADKSEEEETCHGG